MVHLLVTAAKITVSEKQRYRGLRSGKQSDQSGPGTDDPTATLRNITRNISVQTISHLVLRMLIIDHTNGLLLC